MVKAKKMQSTWDMDVKELVIARLSTLPPTRRINIGGYGEFSKDELINAIEEDDEAGMIFVKMQMDYLRAIAKGKII